MQAGITKGLAVVVLALSWSLLTPAARSADACYAVIFASQSKPNRARLSHTFATFVKVPENADGRPDVQRMESHTISWLAATTKVVLLRPRAEPGANFGLPASLQLAVSQNTEISAWGPYRVQKELYDRARAQIDRLSSGAISYKALDGGLRPEVATNCIHAVSDIVAGPQLSTGTAYGNAASEMVRDHLSRWIIDPKTTHRFLIAPLGLDKYSITYQD